MRCSHLVCLSIALRGQVATATERAVPADAQLVPAERTPSDRCDAEAKQLFDDAAAAYQAKPKQLLLARSLMQRVYDRCGLPDYLYNLALLDRELGNCDSALQNFRAFAARDASSARLADAQRQIDELNLQCGAPPPQKAEAAGTSEASPRRLKLVPQGGTNVPRVIGWSCIGVGAAAGVTAIYFAVTAANRAHEERMFLQKSAARPPEQRSVWDATLEDDYKRSRNLAIVSGITSGALLTAGIVLVARKPPQDSPVAGASLAFDADQLFASYTHRF